MSRNDGGDSRIYSARGNRKEGCAGQKSDARRPFFIKPGAVQYVLSGSGSGKKLAKCLMSPALVLWKYSHKLNQPQPAKAWMTWHRRRLSTRTQGARPTQRSSKAQRHKSTTARIYLRQKHTIRVWLLRCVCAQLSIAEWSWPSFVLMVLIEPGCGFFGFMSYKCRHLGVFHG